MPGCKAIDRGYPKPPLPVSKQKLCIAGLLVSVFGLDELRPDSRQVACLWLLHPRLQDQSSMDPIAFSAIRHWHEQQRASQKSAELPGLIAVGFDQRNHGSREINSLANLDWKSGNPRHAQDMFATYHGTAVDASHLLNYLPSYIFPRSEHSIIRNIACGVSLGGHAAWQCLIQDSRFTAAIAIVGCPDYVSLLSDRAISSKLKTAGADFLGSTDFPKSLVEAMQNYDPAAQLLGTDPSREDRFYRDPTPDEVATIGPTMDRAFRDRRILTLSGGADTLVPYSRSEPFLNWLKRVSSPSGFFSDGNLYLEDLVFEGVGHCLSPDMAVRVDEFVAETLQSQPKTDDQKSRL